MTKKTVDVRDEVHILFQIQQLDNDKIAYLMHLPESYQILQSYSVGTERIKIKLVSPPNDNEFIPLRMIGVKSVLAHAKEKMNKKTKPKKVKY